MVLLLGNRFYIMWNLYESGFFKSSQEAVGVLLYQAPDKD